MNLSDFLQPVTPMGEADIPLSNDHVQRGPFQQNVLRIRRMQGGPTGPKVGVFLYCQQHAREWATPLTCLETAEQLLRNYGLDPKTRKLVDNLDIFILPSSNPDGSHYSLYNFASQRKNMTNHCVNGGKTSDDPMAADFWTPRVNPGTGVPYTNSDPASRNCMGRGREPEQHGRDDLGCRRSTGYIGASHSCTSETYTGPGEASEPEIKNELWVADTFPNIKFSNNIHSFGGYFMWAPGTYLPNRDEGEAVHANIGVEKYFFEAGDQILNRIKDVRGTAILPGAHRPDRRRPLLGGRQQRRRALVPPRRDRVQLRDGRRPLRQHDAVRGHGGRRDGHQAREPDRLPAGRHDHVRQGHRRPQETATVALGRRRRPGRARLRT